MAGEKSCVAHMRGVVAYMDEHASDYNLTREQMKLVDLMREVLQDTGYLYGKEDYIENSAGLVPGLVSDLPYITLVGDLMMTPSEYASANDIPPHMIPGDLLLLWEADMMVDPSGEVVGFKKRIADIRERFGENSREYAVCSETTGFLIKKRANERLHSSGSALKIVEHLLCGTY